MGWGRTQPPLGNYRCGTVWKRDGFMLVNIEAKEKIVQGTGALKRAGETANLLAQLLPRGGKASKMRRGVMHLAETTLLSALFACLEGSMVWQVIRSGYGSCDHALGTVYGDRKETYQ